MEGAVFACLEASYLALRVNISRSPLEESALVPAAVLGILNLLCITLSSAPADTQKLNFHVVFAFWLFFLYCLVECSLSSSLTSSLSLNPFAAAICLSILTVHMLVSAAPVLGVMWQGTAWADVFLALATSFHACVSHGTQQTLGLAVFLLLLTFLSLALSALRAAYPYFPAAARLGGYNLSQILEILKVCSQALSLILALALAYLTSHTTWALPVVCLPPLALLSVRVAVQPTDPAATADPSAPPASAVHSRAQQPVDTIPPRSTQVPDMFQPRQPPFNPAVFPAVPSMSRFTQDALLFKNTRSFMNTGKKNS